MTVHPSNETGSLRSLRVALENPPVPWTLRVYLCSLEPCTKQSIPLKKEVASATETLSVQCPSSPPPLPPPWTIRDLRASGRVSARAITVAPILHTGARGPRDLRCQEPLGWLLLEVVLANDLVGPFRAPRPGSFLRPSGGFLWWTRGHLCLFPPFFLGEGAQSFLG